MEPYEFERSRAITGPRATRQGDSTVLTCATCGCRLTARQSLDDGAGYGPDAAWRHFWGEGDRDARGCLVDCMDRPHRIVPLEISAG
jgi:hypothetical protein